MALRHIRTINLNPHYSWPYRMLKKSVSKAAGESKPEAYHRGYVEDFDEPRTPLAGFSSILLMIIAGIPIRPPTFFHQDELIQQSRRDRVQKPRGLREQHAAPLIEHIDRVRQE